MCKHTTCSQLPELHLNRPMTTLRNANICNSWQCDKKWISFLPLTPICFANGLSLLLASLPTRISVSHFCTSPESKILQLQWESSNPPPPKKSSFPTSICHRGGYLESPLIVVYVYIYYIHTVAYYTHLHCNLCSSVEADLSRKAQKKKCY